MNTLFEILISSGCSGIVALVICYIFARVNRRDEADLKQLATLQEARLKKLEDDRDSMLALTGSVQQMAANMKDLQQDFKKLLVETAAQGQAISNQMNYLANLREDQKDDRKNLERHIALTMNNSKK